MNLDEMKEKYKSGFYIALYYPKNPAPSNDRWIIAGIPTWTKASNWQIIHKKHKDILDAYLADNNVEIEYIRNKIIEWEWTKEKNFIENYDGLYNYKLKHNIITNFEKTYCTANELHYNELVKDERFNVRHKLKRGNFITIESDLSVGVWNESFKFKQIHFNTTINKWVYGEEKDGKKETICNISMEKEKVLNNFKLNSQEALNIKEDDDNNFNTVCNNSDTATVLDVENRIEITVSLSKKRYEQHLKGEDVIVRIKGKKKKWYEDESNFPCLIWSCSFKEFQIAYNKNMSHMGDRPATKEEALKLVVEETK